MTAQPAPKMDASERAAEADALGREMVAARTVQQLCDTFAMTEVLPNPDEAVFTVRGWIIEELEKRDPDAWGAWMDSGEDLPHRFYGVAITDPAGA